MATAVFQLLFANSFAAVFASALVTCTTSLTYAFCCAALGAGIVDIALVFGVRERVAFAGVKARREEVQARK
jgi:hypothetical protein